MVDYHVANPILQIRMTSDILIALGRIWVGYFLGFCLMFTTGSIRDLATILATTPVDFPSLVSRIVAMSLLYPLHFTYTYLSSPEKDERAGSCDYADNFT